MIIPILFCLLAFFQSYNFEEVSSIQLSSRPSDILVVDLDRDGIDEIITTENSKMLHIWKYQSNSYILADSPIFSMYLPYGAGSIITDDFNKDGWPDLAVSGWLLSTLISMTPYHTDSINRKLNFTKREDGFGFGTEHIISGDLDNDGWTDIVASTGNHTIRAKLNFGGNWNGFSPSFEISSGIGFVSALKIIDINNDGLKDIVSTSIWNPTAGVHIYYNEGIGFDPNPFWISTTPAWFNPGQRAAFISKWDVDKDGIEDFIVPWQANPEIVTLFHGRQGQSPFRISHQVATAYVMKRGVIAHLNSDNNVDYVYVSYNSDFSYANKIIIVPGIDSSPYFEYNYFNLNNTEYTISDNPILQEVEVGDVNGDGKTDIIVMNIRTHKIHILLNRG